MKYYSAMKMNEVGSFVETWMDLETVTQSEVSQKEKHYTVYGCIHVESRKMVQRACLQGSNRDTATSYKELTHWKRPWCWEGLGTGGEGDNRGWDGWMASPTQWTWVWVNSRSWWWTGRPGVLQFMGSQRVGHDWAELNWIETQT